jgi:hypothetical protein
MRHPNAPLTPTGRLRLARCRALRLPKNSSVLVRAGVRVVSSAGAWARVLARLVSAPAG